MGNTCLPRQTTDVAEESTPLPDSAADADAATGEQTRPTDGRSEMATGDSHDGRDVLDEARPQGEVAEIQDVATPTGAVGDPCSRDRDCRTGLSCLGWDHGYCSLLQCNDTDRLCPAGSLCLPLIENDTACFLPCQDDSDCRTEHSYACKAFADGQGLPVRVCHALSDEQLPIGSACQENSQCADAMACLQSLPGGYCAELFCGVQQPCAADAACLDFEGIATCLKRCSLDADCQTPAAPDLACVSMRDRSDAVVSVCLTRQQTLPIGAACLNDFDCLSQQCLIYGTGRCHFTHVPCFTLDDCQAESCDPGEVVGACTEPCSTGSGCLSGGKCVSTDGTLGQCMPTCHWDDVHMSHDCRSDAGWQCVFGIALADVGTGSYVCAEQRPGQVASSCAGESDCEDDLTCLLPGVTNPEGQTLAGYCTRSCSAVSGCPFGTYCLQYQGRGMPRCIKVCLSEHDCPADYRCTSQPWSGGTDICLPGT